MVPKTVKEEEIHRCPFCSKKPKITLQFEIWKATCNSGWHYVQTFAKTRAGVIKRWNRNG